MNKKNILDFYLKQVPVNTDLNSERNERFFPLPKYLKRLVLPWMNDPRDFLAIELLGNMFLFQFPLIILLCIYPSHTFGAFFFFFRMILFAERFMLTLHVVSHRPLFQPRYKLLNSLPETIFAICMGLPPGCYHIHHVMMHHCENNIFPHDITSTMPYQRDSLLGLLAYIIKYFTHSIFYLPYYAFKKRKYKILCYHVVFSVFYFGLTPILYQAYPVQVLWLIIIPYVVLGAALMHGNFAQHVFVDPQNPNSSYTLAYNVVNHSFNKRTYNDGYHIIHHLYSTLHWSEMPRYFIAHIDKFAEHDALVFQGIDNAGILSLVFTGNYNKLYKHWVQLQPDNVRTVQQFKCLCLNRLKPIPNSDNEKSR